METKEITAQNELIALFMGAKLVTANLFDYKTTNNAPTEHSSVQWNSPNMKYHKDWSWLMPVVKKTANIKGFFDVENDLNCLRIHADIENVYNACVSFIKYYNQNKPL